MFLYVNLIIKCTFYFSDILLDYFFLYIKREFLFQSFFHKICTVIWFEMQFEGFDYFLFVFFNLKQQRLKNTALEIDIIFGINLKIYNRYTLDIKKIK